jgi:hypothetical protein
MTVVAYPRRKHPGSRLPSDATPESNSPARVPFGQRAGQPSSCAIVLRRLVFRNSSFEAFPADRCIVSLVESLGTEISVGAGATRKDVPTSNKNRVTEGPYSSRTRYSPQLRPRQNAPIGVLPTDSTIVVSAAAGWQLPPSSVCHSVLKMLALSHETVIDVVIALP